MFIRIYYGKCNWSIKNIRFKDWLSLVALKFMHAMAIYDWTCILNTVLLLKLVFNLKTVFLTSYLKKLLKKTYYVARRWITKIFLPITRDSCLQNAVISQASLRCRISFKSNSLGGANSKQWLMFWLLNKFFLIFNAVNGCLTAHSQSRCK